MCVPMVLTSRQMVRLLFELGAVVPQPSKVKVVTHRRPLGRSNAKVWRRDSGPFVVVADHSMTHARSCALCIVVATTTFTELFTSRAKTTYRYLVVCVARRCSRVAL